MAADNSFDVVSKVDLQEVKNAVDQATKEVNARFDLKNSKSTIVVEGTDAIQLASQDEYKLKAVIEILGAEARQARRLTQEPRVRKDRARRQLLRPPEDQAAVQGIPSDKAKHHRRRSSRTRRRRRRPASRETPSASSAKTRDVLQEIMALLRGKDHRRRSPVHQPSALTNLALLDRSQSACLNDPVLCRNARFCRFFATMSPTPARDSQSCMKRRKRTDTLIHT